MRVSSLTKEEAYNADDVHYIARGHTLIIEEGLVYVEFSPSEENAKQTEVIGRNVQAMIG